MLILKVAAIIAAYNEEATIGQVVRTFKSSPLISEIIVVSDGSRDNTAEEARAAGANLVLEEKINRGKGGAVSHAIAFTDAPILFLADADLINFSAEHIEQLLSPVVADKIAMCVGLRDRGRLLNIVTPYLPLISGERVLRRTIIDNINTSMLKGFMLEEALNFYCRIHELASRIIILKGLTFKRKMQKVGFWKGLWGYSKMTGEIIKAMIIVRVARIFGKF